MELHVSFIVKARQNGMLALERDIENHNKVTFFSQYPRIMKDVYAQFYY